MNNFYPTNTKKLHFFFFFFVQHILPALRNDGPLSVANWWRNAGPVKETAKLGHHLPAMAHQ
jgi:hypothetical protein